MFTGTGAALLSTRAWPLTPTLGDFDLSEQTGGLCVSDASHIENIVIIGSTALILGVAIMLIGQVMKRRARLRREERFGGTEPHDSAMQAAQAGS